MRYLALGMLVLLCGSAAAATHYVDPLAGKADAKGTKEAPWRTLQEVVDSGGMRHVKPGDTILLRDGLHGRVVLQGDNEDFITIAAEEGCRPKLSYFEISAGKKWKVKGLTISASFAEPTYEGVMLTVADKGESAEIIVEDCFVYSTLDTSTWTADQWMKANSGMTMGRHGSGHVFRNNYVLNTRFGINLCAESSLCEGNVISHFSADGIRVTRDGLVVQHNIIRNIYVSDEDGDKNHDDAIQCFLFNKGTGTVRNVTIRENVVIMREDEAQRWPATMQGIGFFDGPLINFVVDGNVINTSHWHGVSLYDAQGCKITNNVAYTQWTDSKLRPWVELGSKGKGEIKDNEVKNNHAYSFKLSNDKDVKAEGNVIVTEEIHRKRQEALLATIDEKYGKVHPKAGFRRVGIEKSRWIEGAVVDGASGDKNDRAIDAVRDHLNQGKLIVLYAYAEGKREAEACARFERETLEEAAVAKLLDDCVRVRIRLDDDLPREVRSRYHLGSKAPFVVILAPDGTKLWSGGGPTAKALAKQLAEAAATLE